MLGSAKRKTEESSNEGGSNDAAKLTSAWASPVKSRARCEEKRKEEEEEEASNRVSSLPMTWRCRTCPTMKGR